MKNKQVARFVLLIALMGTLTSVAVKAQAVFVTELKRPVKIVAIGGGNLLVAEAGNSPNSGRISLIDLCGNRRTLLDALPTGFSGPNNEPSGPNATALIGRTLYVVMGEGDTLRPGPVGGTNIPNPNPSSPLFSSILAVEFTMDVSRSAGGFTLAAADQATIKNGATITLANGGGETATIRLLADFPDITPSPVPPFPSNVRGSQPFGIEVDGNQFLLVDAALNNVVRVDIATGAISTIVAFPPIANPTPVGPPVIDTVPDGLRLFGDGLLVTTLTGFPFPIGSAEVRRVNRATGQFTPFITGLTRAIDVLPVKTRTGADQFYVLEHSLPTRPGRLLRFDAPAGPPAVILGNLNSPVGLARDPQSGDLFVTEIVTGQILRLASTEFFDVCLQDDRTGSALRFNSTTGDYSFAGCSAGFTLAGRGQVKREGCSITLRGAQVTATLDRCLIAPSNRGRALIRRTFLGPAFLIDDSDTTNNTCAGR